MPKMMCPHCGTEITAADQMDGRTVPWRLRVRLYDGHDELQADSDPDTDAAALGATVVAGLPAVAEHVVALCRGYHGTECAGLDKATLAHRLKSLRPTISRRGGNAVWRVPYTAPDGSTWLARVDLEKVEPTTGDESGRQFKSIAQHAAAAG